MGLPPGAHDVGQGMKVVSHAKKERYANASQAWVCGDMTTRIPAEGFWTPHTKPRCISSRGPDDPRLKASAERVRFLGIIKPK